MHDTMSVPHHQDGSSQQVNVFTKRGKWGSEATMDYVDSCSIPSCTNVPVLTATPTCITQPKPRRIVSPSGAVSTQPSQHITPRLYNTPNTPVVALFASSIVSKSCVATWHPKAVSLERSRRRLSLDRRVGWTVTGTVLGVPGCGESRG